jgi:hypothetical protein
MKTLLASILGLTALASVALADEPTRLTLTQMDQVTAGAASNTFTFSQTASGPNNATNTADVTQTATVVGGLTPSSSASQSGSASSSAD